MIVNIDEILAALPHRYPFLLLDRILEFDHGKSIVGLKNVTINEPFFVGHFPEKPVMPGVLILEALAQAAGMLVLLSDKSISRENSLFLFAGVDGVRYKRIVIPGDQLMLNIEMLRYKQEVYKFKGVATVENELVCSAELIIARRMK